MLQVLGYMLHGSVVCDSGSSDKIIEHVDQFLKVLLSPFLFFFTVKSILLCFYLLQPLYDFAEYCIFYVR